ncbi:MAG: hypothetical protein NXI32_06440 [bacterium]|nr:hypothetical protein [bacterium]
MPLVNLEAAPSKTTLRWFGLSLAVLLLLLAWIFGRGSAAWSFPLGIALFCAAIVLSIVYYAVPKSQIAIIRGWQYVTLPIAWTVGHLMLLLAFFLVFWPIGMLRKALGHDPLQLRDRDATTSWQPKETPDSPTRYFKQY